LSETITGWRQKEKRLGRGDGPVQVKKGGRWTCQCGEREPSKERGRPWGQRRVVDQVVEWDDLSRAKAREKGEKKVKEGWEGGKKGQWS